jgi:hypothetical protein
MGARTIQGRLSAEGLSGGTCQQAALEKNFIVSPVDWRAVGRRLKRLGASSDANTIIRDPGSFEFTDGAKAGPRWSDGVSTPVVGLGVSDSRETSHKRNTSRRSHKRRRERLS